MATNIAQVLAGMEFDFYGVDGYRFKLNDKVFEAVEDPNDGYRSYLETVEIVTNADNSIFFKQPVARVKIESYEDGFILLRVEDNAEVLSVFTDHADDYYPCFRFDYRLPHAPRLPFSEPSKFDCFQALLD